MTAPDLQFWTQLAGVIAFESAIVVALAAAAQRALPSARWQRALWQIVLLSLLALLISELTGLGRGIIGSLIVPRHQIIPAAQDGVPFLYYQLTAGNLPAALHREAPPVSQPAVWWPARLWLAGTALVLARPLLAQFLLFALRFRHVEIINDALRQRLQNVARLIGLKRRVALLHLPQSVSPVAIGLFRPAIGIPPDFEDRFTPAEQEAILAHELAHLAAFDPRWFLFADLLTALLWWHPFVWYARRSFRAASERAADDAAALIADGPASLARCLIDLAKRMTGAAWGWAGINGGFRSNLGRRVERLLHMPSGARPSPTRWPARLARSALALLVAPAIALFFGLLRTHGQVPNSPRASWQSSPAALIFASLETPPSAAPGSAASPSTTRDIASQIEDAKLLFEMRKLDEAEVIFRNALQKDPQNPTAPYYLSLIKASRSSNSTPEVQRPGDRLSTRLQDAKLLYEMGRLNPAQAILDQILRDDPTNQSARYYLNLIKARQPAQSNTNAWSLTEAVLNNGAAARANLLRKLTLIHLAHFECRNSPLTDVLTRLSLETQQLDSNAPPINFIAMDTASTAIINLPHPLKNVSLADVLDAIANGSDQPIIHSILFDRSVAFQPRIIDSYKTKTFRVNPDTFAQFLRAFGESAGLPVRPPAFPGQFDDGPRRANENHDSLGGPTAPAARAMFAIPANDTEQLNNVLRSYFQSMGIDLFQSGKSVFFNNREGFIMVRASDDDLNKITKALSVLNVAPTLITVSAKFVELSRQEAAALRLDSLLQPGPTNLFAVLSESQFHAAIDFIINHTSDDVLSAPALTVLNGRRARLANSGVSIDVAATVGPDNSAIKTEAHTTVGPGPQPWNLAASCTVRDGETILLGQFATNPPNASTLRLVFLTPRLTNAPEK